MEMERAIVVCICSTELPEIRFPIMFRWRDVKIDVYRITNDFGLEIFFQYHEINNHEIKFRVKNTLVASYSRAVIA